MADERRVHSPNARGIASTSLSLNTKSENENPKLKAVESIIPNRKSVPVQGDKNTPNSKSLFANRALSFLKGIHTGSPVISAKPSPMPEPLQLVPSDINTKPNIVRNQEEDIEIFKVQTWVTSGVIKKSYSHCINASDILALGAGRTVINLTEYPGRMIPSPIKDQLNEEFRRNNPQLDQKLTLSKLVNLREDLIVKVWKECGFDPATLAIGLTYFDRLLNMNLVNKRNRKLYAAVCTLLAFKFIEENHIEETASNKQLLMNHLYLMDKHDLLTAKMIHEVEFSVYSYLNFSMHIELKEIEDNLTYVQKRLIHSNLDS